MRSTSPEAGRRASLDQLLERQAELRAIRQALEAACSGTGGSLMIEAGAGLGKSSLLELARSRATELGMTVLRARGSEHEQALVLGGARQIFEGRLHRAGEAERARLLSGSAALARELFAAPAAADRLSGESRALSIIHGLFWLTANLTEPDGGESPARPVALLIDDAHLLDALSLRFVLYLSARLEELPVALLVALRPDHPSRPAELATLQAAPATTLRPGPLSAEAVATLLRSDLDVGAVAAELTQAAVRVTGGNPFLVRALASQLRSDGIEPRAEAAGRIAALAPTTVLQAVVARLARLGPAAAAIAKALAVLGDGAALELVATLAGIEAGTAHEAADGLAAESILAPGDPLSFIHPMVGQAVAAELAPGWRAATELRAARLLAARGARGERVAAHLLHGATGADGWVVEVLQSAAADAHSRGAPEIAAAYLARALREPPASSERARLLAALAQAEAAAGLPGAAGHLDEGLALIETGRERAELLGSLGRLLVVGGRYEEGIEAFRRGVAELDDPHDPRGRELKSALAYAGASGTGSAQAMSAVIDELRSVPVGQETTLEDGVLALAASQAALTGRPASEFAPAALRALQGGNLVREVSRDAGLLLTPAAVALLYADELERSLEVLDAALEQARRNGSVLALATVSYLRTWPLYFTGQVAEAIADAEQALSARRYGWSLHAGAACALLAHARIERGELDLGHAALREAASLGLGEEHWARAALLVASGRLKLAERDPTGAFADLTECGRRLERQGVSDRPIPWRGFAALAALALGDRQGALALATEERHRADRIGAPRIVGIALRIHGLVAGGKRGIASLRTATEVLEGSPAKLEQARALVDLGAAIRRGGTPVASREPLRRGLEMAERFGARALAQQAREELRAAGSRPRRAALSGLESLTPSERRVARLAAQGLTNREIAQQLFVTTKAIEYHLRNAFGKLGISARTQLAALFAEDGAADAR